VQVRIACRIVLALIATVAVAAWSAPALASTVSIRAGDTLLIEGAQGGGKGKAGSEANNFSITYDPVANRYVISDVADITTTDAACTDLGQTVSCAATGITTISVKAGSGDDKAKISATPAPSVTLEGEDGNDTLSGGDDAAGEILRAGKGNDLMLGGDGPDQFFGEQGFDSVSYSEHTTAGVVATIGTIADDGNTADGPATARDNIDKNVEKVAGTTFADRLTGSRNDDTLVGLAGNDRLKGLSGADIFKGKGGIDILLAKDGERDTRLNCGPGANSRERAKRDRGLDPRPKSC
jgi:RTX calcium-binding nonapeptide repeat (4 copies)